jgi:hypothetical protein
MGASAGCGGLVTRGGPVTSRLGFGRLVTGAGGQADLGALVLADE